MIDKKKIFIPIDIFDFFLKLNRNLKSGKNKEISFLVMCQSLSEVLPEI